MGTNLTLVPASVDTSAGTVGPGVTDAYLEMDIGGIEPGASVTVDFDAVVAAPVAAGTTDVRNQTTVRGTNFDDVLSDDDDDATDGIAPTVSLVQTSPGLDIDVTGDLAAEPGDVVTYALGYANTGDIGIDDVVIAADVPAGTQFNAANSTSGWSCESSGDDVVCELSLGALNGGASGTVWFAVALDDDIAAETMTVAAGISSGDVLAGASAPTAIVRPDIAAVMRGPATANPSGEVHYDVTVTNTGSAIAEDVIIESTLPDELVFSPGGDCTATGQVVTCSVGNLDATDGTATLTIDAAVAEDVADGSSLSVSGSVTWALGTPIQTNTIITSVQAIDLTAFVDGTTAGAPGESVVLSVNYANQGGATATGVWIEADLPPGIGLVSLLSEPGWDCTSNVCSVSVGKLSPGGGASALALSIGDVDPSLESVSIKLTIGDDGEHGPDADASDNVTMALITIVRPDLAATLGGPEGTTPGGSFTYEATVANNGTAGVAATVLTDLLPDGLTFDDATSSPQCSAVAQTVSCAVGALGADETATVTIGVLAELRLRDADTLSNYVTVEQATGEAVTGNNTSSTITTSVAAADLGLTVTGGESARPGAGVMYHVEVGNAGSLSASGTWVVVGLADGLTFAPHDSSTGCTRTGETVTCSVTETIVAGGSAGFDIAAVLPDDVSDGTMLGSHITTASGSPESTSTLVDNAADATTTVEYLLSVDASVTGPADATTADPLAYTFTLSNTGDDASIALAVTIGDGLAVDGVSPDGGITCEALDPATNVVACSGTLSREAVASVAVSVHLDGTRLDTAVNLGVAGHAFTGESDARVQDQQFAAAAQISATRTVAVGLTAQASPQRPMPASEVTYTIAAENAGDQLDGVQLTMTLPGGVVFKGVTSDGGMSCVGGQVTTCSTGAAGWGDGARATITITGRISPNAGAGSALVLVATLAHSSGAISVSAAALVASPPPDIVIPIGPLPSAGDEQTHTYHLGFRWTLITWVGADGASPGETVDPGDDEVAGVLAAIYTWDPEANQWRGYFGREAPVNGANDLDALRFGHVYWVAIDGATEAEWTVPLGGAAR
jgi:uncharacterized repeat protein (TIGR01451 family)